MFIIISRYSKTIVWSVLCGIVYNEDIVKFKNEILSEIQWANECNLCIYVESTATKCLMCECFNLR